MPYTFRRTGHRFARDSEIPFAKPIDIDQFVSAQKLNLPARTTGAMEHNLIATNKLNLFPYFQGKVSYHPGTNGMNKQLKLPRGDARHLRQLQALLGLLTFPPRLTLALRKNQRQLNLTKLVNQAQVTSLGGASLKDMGATVAKLLDENPALPVNVIRFKNGRWYHETYQATAA